MSGLILLRIILAQSGWLLQPSLILSLSRKDEHFKMGNPSVLLLCHKAFLVSDYGASGISVWSVWAWAWKWALVFRHSNGMRMYLMTQCLCNLVLDDPSSSAKILDPPLWRHEWIWATPWPSALVTRLWQYRRQAWLLSTVFKMWHYTVIRKHLFLGSSYVLLVRKKKTFFGFFLKRDECLAISLKRFRRELSIDVAEHRSV